MMTINYSSCVRRTALFASGFQVTILFSCSVAILNFTLLYCCIFVYIAFMDLHSIKQVFSLLFQALASPTVGLESLVGWLTRSQSLASWITQSEPGEPRAICFFIASLW